MPLELGMVSVFIESQFYFMPHLIDGRPFMLYFLLNAWETLELAFQIHYEVLEVN